MINNKVILLLSLASYVACGGGPNPPFEDGSIDKFSDDDDNGAPLTLAVKPIGPVSEDKPIQEDTEGEFYDTVLTPVEDVQANDTEEFLGNNDNRLGDPSNPLNEDKPISEDKLKSEDTDDEFYDTVMTHVNSGIEDMQNNNTGKPQIPTKLPEPEQINSNFQVQGLAGSGLHSSRSSERNVPMFGNCGSTIIQKRTFGFTFGLSNYNINGISIAPRGETLWVDGKKVQGLNAKVRPLVVEWAGGSLKVNGKTYKEFDGIRGSGIWNCI